MGVAWQAEIILRVGISATKTIKEENEMTNIFDKLRTQKPTIDRQERIKAISTELAGCKEVIEKYGESLAEIKSHLVEIESYVCEIAQERERLMAGEK